MVDLGKRVSVPSSRIVGNRGKFHAIATWLALQAVSIRREIVN
jgi:hypothetical protein